MNQIRKRDWARLGHFLKARRLMLGLTQADLAAKAGVSMGTVTNIESGKTHGRLPHKLPLIEALLGWEPGSAARVLDGGNPVELGAAIAVRPIPVEVKADLLKHVDGAGQLSAPVRRELRDWIEALPENP